LCRAVFSKFKACLTIDGVNAYRRDYNAINIVYKSLQEDRGKADITDIIRQLHKTVDEAINVQPDQVAEDQSPYDISMIDFYRLRLEFEQSPAKRTTVQNLKEAIEKRLQRLLEQNPLRTDFQQHYEKIVTEYNREKDRVTIEKTFEALLRFVNEMSEEDRRTIREGLDEESLAIFDLLRKEELSPFDIKRIKAVLVELLDELKSEKLRVDHWRDKEATRDAVRITIRDFLWSEETGLPVDSYDEVEVNNKADDVFVHVFRAYPTAPSPYHTAAS
jgi:type I restriction enzyme R subunit